MQWRPVVLLLTGIFVIYLVSLLQEVPHPHPLQIHIDLSKAEHATLIDSPDEALLLGADSHIYLTSIWYEYGQVALRTGTGSAKTAVTGRIILMQKPRDQFFQSTNTSLYPSFQQGTGDLTHSLRGPISKVSLTNNNNSPLRLAVLYHILDGEMVQHMARIYYFAVDTDCIEYKDLYLPGTTMIDSFTLENNSILYSRDPDNYRFRILPLPTNLMNPPHSSEADFILLTPEDSYTGDQIRPYQQPLGTLEHEGVIAQLYSPQVDVYRVFSLDVYKTQFHFHINMTLVDNATIIGHSTTPPGWTLKGANTLTNDVFSDETLEFMAFVDGANFHQERIKLSMPKLCLTRSADARTLVFPTSHTNILTVDFGSDIEYMLANENEKGYSSKNRSDETVHASHWWPADTETTLPQFDVELRGVRLNEKGNLLAIWTDVEVYIYKRGGPGGMAEKCSTQANIWPGSFFLPSDDTQMSLLDWCPPMTVPSPSADMLIGSASFWNEVDLESNMYKDFILVAFKNGVVASYLVDELEEQAEVDFWNFLRNKWSVWLGM